MARSLRDRLGVTAVSVPHGQGRRWVQRATCKCGATKDMPAARSPHDNEIAELLTSAGWSTRGGKCVCPECQDKKRHRTYLAVVPSPAEIEEIFNPAQEEEPILAEPATVPVPIASPDRATKQRIHAEIAGNWDDKTERYIGSASDQSIATALGVPRAWVADIRAEWFGDYGGNAEIEKFKAELDQHIGDVDRLIASSLELAEKYEAVGKELKAMRARLERIEKSTLPRGR